MFTAPDYSYMSHALRLAEKGMFTTSPNPRVGCVIVNNGKVVGTGWHERAGEPHAEVHALREAGNQARGATVYVTLEPCSHYGRTPPCVDTLIEAGVGKVVMAVDDPAPHVNGQGKKKLQAAGIEVQSGLLADEAGELNIGFMTRMHAGRPWVRTKIAASLDGKTALNNGKSQWITNEPARRDGHKWRARSCAVLTGIGSVKKDDPLLTVRHIESSRQPVRVVVDSNLEMPLQARLLHNADTVWIFTVHTGREKIHRLEDAGAHVVVLPDVSGRVDLKAMMMKLAEQEINELLVEAGSVLNGALVAAGLIDEIIFYFAPCLLGDSARGMLTLPEISDLSGKQALKITDIRTIGADIRLVARFLK
ncbi:bifunctional diaminohydroxyphosphoribosylaminopyrimidine deaminase/5-amino-6-(5-phosphoribosylamino)uracil reductase RibD [Betaproteobacteria bacterium PRO4]|uniref:bifunctional diaminohydroxyphosphoribosylaminopyrimidine deaminase/5-amino-6-(5-phosphoribosylamino)uracil reductase RibD n=1 Tax=Nitrosomonas sp. TaxID=42353 RepID=UPI002566C2FF|nr:bifunctional diaminohydroxyphosphoribosylaminopyrimidine deaminase/5-amino-6-(5-phosphoribosylamino)uracil reductase RibD [Nitrosomonas sp.]MDL1865734.1 bifunctional diaminohydroxyphosphoribosylaminopyrimidine deaminase/5-amino-6-(5-phosphoribosylamino)uracil reductase RibD [Betaproteobacteria bacterium PRO4]